MPFVIGIEIKLSNNHTCKGVIGRFVDICDDLAGVYPKEFKFVGWHPHCRCFAIAKMASAKECNDYFDRLEAGEDVSNYQFSSKVKELPQNFQNWYIDNTDRIARAKSQPYFLRDNAKLIDKQVRLTIPQYGHKAGALITADEKDVFNSINESKSYSLEDAQLNWNISNPEKFNNGIADKFDWKTFHDELLDVTSKHGIELKTFSMALSDKSTEFTVVGDGFRMIRNLGLEEGTLIANHNFLLLSKESQNKGLSKDIFRSLYK